MEAFDRKNYLCPDVADGFFRLGAQGAQAEETGIGAKKPKNIALLPVENLGLLADCGGDQYVSQQLERVVHVPLNGVTKMAAYIDPETARRELASLVNSGRYVTKKTVRTTWP